MPSLLTVSGGITKPIRKLAGFREGAKVAILVFENRIELRPMSQMGEKLLTALATEKVLARDWNSKEDEEAWKTL